MDTRLIYILSLFVTPLWCATNAPQSNQAQGKTQARQTAINTLEMAIKRSRRGSSQVAGRNEMKEIFRQIIEKVYGLNRVYGKPLPKDDEIKIPELFYDSQEQLKTYSIYYIYKSSIGQGKFQIIVETNLNDDILKVEIYQPYDAFSFKTEADRTILDHISNANERDNWTVKKVGREGILIKYTV